MPQIFLNSGTVFLSEGDSSILQAALSANIVMPYSCKTGRCSTCRSKVIQGKTTPLLPELGLSDEEKTNGWILSCARVANTDVVLEVDDISHITLPPIKTLPCRINQINRLAPDVIQVFLRLPPTVDFSFNPGQYIEIIGPQGIRRSYSLANADCTNKVLELHIRAVAEGAMSHYWFNQAQNNDLLRLNGPLGTFFLRETANIDLIFLATGTGIAPIKAMLEAITVLPDSQSPKSVTILWGGRSLTDFYYNIAAIASKHTYIPVLSRPITDATYAKGYVQDVLLGLEPNLKNAVVYACGSDTMIHSARTRLMQAGLSPKQFHSDAFVCSSKN